MRSKNCVKSIACPLSKLLNRKKKTPLLCKFLQYSPTDVIDSSGFRFYYTSIPREHRAGILYLGHHVTRKMIIPPNAPNYTITGFCPSNCTDTVSGLYCFSQFNIYICLVLHHFISLQEREHVCIPGNIDGDDPAIKSL